MSKSYNPSSKNNNGWILCPSKTFPGKFYYFNVVNGEAAWSMNETEKFITKRDNEIHKITDKYHCYPEPDTPPLESPEITTTNNLPTYQQFKPPNLTNISKSSYVQLPTFGQAAFPKYVPKIESCMPIVWMPIQCPTSVCVPEVKRSTTDQITQTSDPSILVHACGPCCKRFVNYDQPILNFDKQNKILNKDTYSRCVTSMLLKNKMTVPNLKMIEPATSILNKKEFQFQSNIPNLKMKESVFETSTPKKKEFQIQTGVPSFKIRKPVFNLESDSNISHVDNGNSTLGPGDSVDSCKSDYVKLLPETDLRHRLLSSAMRRNIGDKIDGHTDLNKNKVTKYESKKKVSFDLSNFLDEETCSTTYIENMPSTSANESPQVCGNVAATRTVWYIVVDTDVWLDEHEFIETIVLSDKNCKLLIPHAVRTDIEALSQGECRGRQRVFVARQLARRCATPPQHYVVDSAVSTAAGTLFTTDSILECCIDAVNDNYHVIIISNDPQLHIKAKSNNIPCYKIQDIKNTDIHTQAELDLKKIKITVSRDYDDIPNGETIDNISDDTLEMSVDSYRTQLLRENNVEGHKTDSKNVENPILNYDSDSTTNEIRDLMNLNLKDKNQVLKIKRTVLNSNYNPNSNTSKVRNEKEGIVKAVANSNIGDEFLFQKPISKWNCENSMLQFQKPVPNLNCNESFLFQNAAKKYASTQLFDLKKPSKIPETFLNPNNLLIENTKTLKTPQSPKKIQTENKRIPKITEPKLPEKNKQPSFPVKINLNSNFKFQQTNLKIPPSFHFQTQNELKKNVDHMPVLDEQIKNIDLDLKRFCVKSKIIDGKIQRRMEEWLCTYIQIMEDILNDVLQQSDHIVKKKLTPPWSLQEAILNIQIIYEDNAIMKYLVQKYLDFLAYVTCTKGRLNKNMKSKDFMNILGCGILFVQQFKNIYPEHRQLVDAEKNLNLLLETIECPIELHIEEFDLLPPAVCRSEMEEVVTRSNFVKDPAYVVDYLKKHYKEWESYVLKEKPSVTAPPEMKVLRTFGKHLNMLKIDNNKSISLLKDNDEKDGPKTIRSLNNKQPVERSAAKYMPLATKDTGTNNDEPKMIELSQTNQRVKRSLSLKKPLTKAIGTTNKKVEPETVELIQCDKRITRSHTKNAVNISETENAGPKLVRTLANHHFKNETDFEKQINETLQKAEAKMMSLESPIHGNTFLQSKHETAGPKVIRNLKSLDKYKNLFKQPLDLDLLDYSEINESFTETNRNDDIISISCDSYNATDITLNINQANDNRINDESKNDDYNIVKNTMNNENTSNITKKTNKNQGVSMNDYLDSSNDYRGNDVSRNDSCTNDSGFENDSTCAHSVVKIFFTELSDSFKMIHKFINDCAKEIKNNPSEDRKKVLHEKAARSLEHVGVMIQQMNSIITRELNETTALRTLLLQAGIEASADKRISRYRQFVTKCVEQAGILSNALKIIVSLTGEVDSASIGVDSVGSSVRYFNIFDIAS